MATRGARGRRLYILRNESVKIPGINGRACVHSDAMPVKCLLDDSASCKQADRSCARRRARTHARTQTSNVRSGFVYKISALFLIKFSATASYQSSLYAHMYYMYAHSRERIYKTSTSLSSLRYYRSRYALLFYFDSLCRFTCHRQQTYNVFMNLQTFSISDSKKIIYI